jgi:hypothetical protein
VEGEGQNSLEAVVGLCADARGYAGVGGDAFQLEGKVEDPKTLFPDLMPGTYYQVLFSACRQLD